MISALVVGFSGSGEPVSPEGLVRTLAALVPAAIENLVRDVTLIGPASDPDLQSIADHAGCSLLLSADEEEGLRLGLARSRQELSLILRAGYAPRPGFAAELAELSRQVIANQRRSAALHEDPRGLYWLRVWRRPVALLARRAVLLDERRPDLVRLTRRARPDAKFSCGVLKFE